MKYYLFLGYQIIEKNSKLPKVKIFNDSILIDEFFCDNESSTTIESVYKEQQKNIGPYGNHTVKQNYEFSFDTPKKMKLYELDSSSWHSDSEIKIQVCDNKSNYNNGFMTKSSMVLLNPVFLIPKWLYEDKTSMEKIFLKSARLLGHMPGWHNMDISADMSMDISDSREQWPGFCTTSESLPDMQDLCSGGDFERTFKIRHKHGLFFITKAHKHKVGFFKLDRFTHAWYQWMHKYRFTFLGSLDGKSRDITLVKKDINIENEDQRSNHT